MCKDLYEKVKNGREAMTSSPNSTTGGFIYDGDMKKDVRIYKGLKAYLKGENRAQGVLYFK